MFTIFRETVSVAKVCKVEYLHFSACFFLRNLKERFHSNIEFLVRFYSFFQVRDRILITKFVTFFEIKFLSNIELLIHSLKKSELTHRVLNLFLKLNAVHATLETEKNILVHVLFKNASLMCNTLMHKFSFTLFSFELNFG